MLLFVIGSRLILNLMILIRASDKYSKYRHKSWRYASTSHSQDAQALLIWNARPLHQQQTSA